MRPIERKVLSKIDDKGFTLEQIEEIVDGTTRTELKKSYPDDSHFQPPKYFAKQIWNSLLRYRLVKREGNRLQKIEPKKDQDKS